MSVYSFAFDFFLFIKISKKGTSKIVFEIS